ncbi:MAG: DUF429 domain-containing protein, partial [Stellaceae bacterium]
MSFIGIDGCPGGWIAVALDGERHDMRLLPTIVALGTIAATRVMIDMPIGLPESGRRRCDLAARALLGPAARSRIFLDARRPLLAYRAAADYAAANQWAKRDGNGISRQLWNILPKIAEVDRFITPGLQGVFREAHPELAFMRLGGSAALPSKQTPKGRRLRRDVVRAAGISAIDRWLAALPRGCAPDDLLDA